MDCWSIFFNHSHAERTKTMLDKYHLWNHSDFVQYGISAYQSYTLQQYKLLVAQPAVEIKSRGKNILFLFLLYIGI